MRQPSTTRAGRSTSRDKAFVAPSGCHTCAETISRLRSGQTQAGRGNAGAGFAPGCAALGPRPAEPSPRKVLPEARVRLGAPGSGLTAGVMMDVVDQYPTLRSHRFRQRAAPGQSIFRSARAPSRPQPDIRATCLSPCRVASPGCGRRDGVGEGFGSSAVLPAPVRFWRRLRCRWPPPWWVSAAPGLLCCPARCASRYRTHARRLAALRTIGKATRPFWQ